MIYETTTYDPARHFVLFIHIRKTGGSSLGLQMAAALEAAGITGGYRRLQMQALESYNKGLRLAHEKLRRRWLHLVDETGAEARRALGVANLSMDTVTVASGHVRVDSVNAGRRDPLLVTLVREPVDRLVSEYFFTRDRVNAASRKPGAEKKKRAAALSFEDYAEMLIERADELPLNGQSAYFSEAGDFASARKIIDQRFLLAAPTPRMARFSELLGAKLGIPLGATQRRNKGVSRPARFEPDARLRARLEAAMSEDCALYDHVTREFDALSARVGEIAGPDSQYTNEA